MYCITVLRLASQKQCNSVFAFCRSFERRNTNTATTTTMIMPMTLIVAITIIITNTLKITSQWKWFTEMRCNWMDVKVTRAVKADWFYIVIRIVVRVSSTTPWRLVGGLEVKAPLIFNSGVGWTCGQLHTAGILHREPAPSKHCVRDWAIPRADLGMRARNVLAGI
jgi:hypothetical protein